MSKVVVIDAVLYQGYIRTVIGIKALSEEPQTIKFLQGLQELMERHVPKDDTVTTDPSSR
jgi:hypothetical protein